MTLSDAFADLLVTAAKVGPAPSPGPGEWGAEQILAHLTVVNAVTIGAVASVGAGFPATYDMRAAHDPWTLARVNSRTSLARLRDQGQALCALSSSLSPSELDTLIPALLISNGEILVDQPLPLRDLLTGLADVELPGHRAQLLAL
ncbi:hypothetical protein KOI35_04020 [Actinoplanes bogorensis]|uniref:DinB-like domain-containing protein n=1 Tax=Paractinoplanes bogorensis TaxID=1610840 RepID=A0ABS5YGZ2_9ACTN|nr:hypothetical protein [Actinoplanes bogorensis]MBU2662665.1 hypothetical protein [Actinoplanes bogorensis]